MIFFISIGNSRKVDHLLKLDGANERLQLFKADLLEEGSFDSVIQGCHGVFHTASPVHFVVTDPQVKHYIYMCVCVTEREFLLTYFGHVVF